MLFFEFYLNHSFPNAADKSHKDRSIRRIRRIRSMRADSLLPLLEATLLALKEVEDPATKATLMHKLVRVIRPESGRSKGPGQDLLRYAGVFVCARSVLAGLVPTLDPRDEDQTDAVETACALIGAATDDNQASQAAANAAGLGPILIDLARAGPTKCIRSAAGAALIAMDLPPCACHAAKSTNNKAKVLAALLCGARADGCDACALRPLSEAAKAGNREILLLLILNGASVNKRNPDRSTPLHWCSTTECADALLRAGAIRCLRDKAGYTPLQLHALNGTPEIIRKRKRGA